MPHYFALRRFGSAAHLSRSLTVIQRGRRSVATFVPKHEPSTHEDVAKVQRFVSHSERLFVLTGAGISTESGIPDYRSEGVGLYARSKTRPVQFKDFMRHAAIRQRYWARNFVGWPRFSSVQPNAAHLCLADWEKAGKTTCIVTQNVDRLHHKAGTERVIELHGSSYTVKCTACGHAIPRTLFQQVLKDLNPAVDLEAVEIRPDGDVDLDADLVKGFKVPDCDRCSGILKPDIVFFGDNVPRARVESVYDELERSDAVLVVGSSLQVYSGYRFVLAAIEAHKPVLVINIGPTRADQHQVEKVERRCGDVLPRVTVHRSTS